jgi:cytoskeletal protein RodZ
VAQDQQTSTDQTNKTTGTQPAGDDLTPGAGPGGGRPKGWLAIAVAVLIAAGLLTLGFLTYNAKDEPKPADQPQQEQEFDNTSPVDEQSVDAADQEIDQTLQELDNDADFNEKQLDQKNLE